MCSWPLAIRTFLGRGPPADVLMRLCVWIIAAVSDVSKQCIHCFVSTHFVTRCVLYIWQLVCLDIRAFRSLRFGATKVWISGYSHAWRAGYDCIACKRWLQKHWLVDDLLAMNFNIVLVMHSLLSCDSYVRQFYVRVSQNLACILLWCSVSLWVLSCLQRLVLEVLVPVCRMISTGHQPQCMLQQLQQWHHQPAGVTLVRGQHHALSKSLCRYVKHVWPSMSLTHQVNAYNVTPLYLWCH